LQAAAIVTNGGGVSGSTNTTGSGVAAHPASAAAAPIPAQTLCIGRSIGGSCAPQAHA
jgi:hypothetical protein